MIIQSDRNSSSGGAIRKVPSYDGAVLTGLGLSLFASTIQKNPKGSPNGLKSL
jgi:hypothetical protein